MDYSRGYKVRQVIVRRQHPPSAGIRTMLTYCGRKVNLFADAYAERIQDCLEAFQAHAAVAGGLVALYLLFL